MINKINALLKEVENLKAANAEELEALRIKYLSKKGEISLLMNDFRNVAADQKREVGQHLNKLKEATQNRINELKASFENVQTTNDDIDLTRTSYPIELGTRHPLSLVKKEICDIFGRLGFSIAEGPEIEDDWHVFSSLNFAEDHPARDMQDTFFINIIRTYCFVHTLLPYKHVSWRIKSLLSVLSVRDVYIVMKRSPIAHTVSSIR